MKKLLNLIFILVSLTVFSQTQNIKWEKTYGGSSYDMLYSTIPTSDGGYLLGGMTLSNDGDVQSGNHGNEDYWVVKRNSTGTIEWEQTYGGSGRDELYTTTPTSDGGYLLGGYTFSNDGDIQSGNHGGNDYWVVKINSAGTIEWEQTYGGSSQEELNTITPTSDSGYLLGGYTSSNDGDIQSGNYGISDYWVVKINSAGTIEWEQTYGGTGRDGLYSTITTSDGGYLLGGYTKSNDGDIQSGNHGNKDYWVVKINSSGTIEWEQTYGGSIIDYLYSTISTSDGGYLLGGYTESNDGDIQSGNHGTDDYWVVKINSTGTLEWEQTYGGSEEDIIRSQIMTSDGGYLLCGYTDSNDGDIQSGNHGSGDYWVVKVNSTGTIEWEQTYGGGGSDELYSTNPTTDSGYLLGGYTSSNDGDIQSGNHGDFDYWVVKIGTNNLPTNITLSNSSIDENLPIGTEVGTFISTDDDPVDTHTYSLVSGDGDNDNDSFTITDDKLLTYEIFDYETKSSYSIRVQTDDGNGTFSKSFTISVNNLNDIVITNIIYGNPYCLDDTIGSIEIEIGGYIPPLSFLWSSGQTTQNIYNVVSGNYSITITDGEGMVLNEQFNLEPQPIFEGTNICYLTSDEIYNVVHIDKGSENYNVDRYIVYREGSNVGVYEYIGEINSNENYYTDTTINNMTRSYSYKVSMMDKCGNESTQSTNHSTIHLSINSGTNNEVNLSWSHYIGLNPPSYSIYRKLVNEDFVLLEEISSNNNTYTDFPPESNSLYGYYISFEVENMCDTIINRDFIEIKSNYVSLGGPDDVNELSNQDIKIYPNPVNDKLFVNLENVQLNVNQILLFNSNGKLVFLSEGTELKSKIIEIPTLNYNTGLYNLNLYTKQGVIQRKIVIVR